MTQINETLSKMQHLMYYKSEEKPVERQNSLEFMREGVDNKVYGIVHEGTSYYIKVAEKTGKNLLPENFDYVGGFVNRGRMKYSSYTDALKNLDMHLQELRTSLGKKAIVIESTNPGYKETLFTTATGELAEEIKRQRQIMANVKVIEEGGMMVTPVGKEIGKPGDSTPFGDKNIDTNKVEGKDGFDEKPKDAKESGEPANATAKSVDTAKDGLKDVPGASKGVKAAEKPVMKEGVEDIEDKPDVEEPDVETPDAENTEAPKEETQACEGVEDKLQAILDRITELENKVDKLPFSGDDDVVPGDDGDDDGAGDVPPVEGAPADTDIDIDLGGDGEGDNDTSITVEESFDGTDTWEDDEADLNKRFPWLAKTDAELAAAEKDTDAAEAAMVDMDKEAAEEEARRQAEEDAMKYNPEEGVAEEGCKA